MGKVLAWYTSNQNVIGVMTYMRKPNRSREKRSDGGGDQLERRRKRNGWRLIRGGGGDQSERKKEEGGRHKDIFIIF